MLSFLKVKRRQLRKLATTIEMLKACQKLHKQYLEDQKKSKPATNNFKTYITTAILEGEAQLNEFRN